MRNLRQKTILVLDDHVELSEAMRELLADAGYHADAYCDPVQALASLSARPLNELGLLLVDFWLPQMNGLDFVTAARGVGVAAPAVFVTAVPSSLLDQAALRALNVVHIVPKPFHVDTLLAVVEAIMAGAGARHELEPVTPAHAPLATP